LIYGQNEECWLNINHNVEDKTQKLKLFRHITYRYQYSWCRQQLQQDTNYPSYSCDFL